MQLIYTCVCSCTRLSTLNFSTGPRYRYSLLFHVLHSTSTEYQLLTFVDYFYWKWSVNENKNSPLFRRDEISVGRWRTEVPHPRGSAERCCHQCCSVSKRCHLMWHEKRHLEWFSQQTWWHGAEPWDVAPNSRRTTRHTVVLRVYSAITRAGELIYWSHVSLEAWG